MKEDFSIISVDDKVFQSLLTFNIKTSGFNLIRFIQCSQCKYILIKVPLIYLPAFSSFLLETDYYLATLYPWYKLTSRALDTLFTMSSSAQASEVFLLLAKESLPATKLSFPSIICEQMSARKLPESWISTVISQMHYQRLSGSLYLDEKKLDAIDQIKAKSVRVELFQ